MSRVVGGSTARDPTETLAAKFAAAHKELSRPNVIASVRLGIDRRGSVVRRRDFIRSLGGAVATFPLAARAQTPDVTKHIGVLSPYAESDKTFSAHLALFRSALEQFGWSEGRHLRIDYGWAGGDAGRLAPLARELVELRPNALLVRATPAALAASRATRTIPIVFMMVSDPVGDGLVTSIASPGGNVTGFTNGLEESIGGKWIEIPRSHQA